MFEELNRASGGPNEDTDLLPLVTVDLEDQEENLAVPEVLPILALKNTVLFPGIVIPITVGRDRSIKAINKAYEGDRMVAVLSQKDQKEENPGPEDLYHIGTVARIIKLLRMPDGTITAVLRGRRRFVLDEMLQTDPHLEGKVSMVNEVPPVDKLEFEAMRESILDLSEKIIGLSPNIPSEALVMLKGIEDEGFLLNFIASNIGEKIKVKQRILEINEVSIKATVILKEMNNQLNLLEIRDKIENKVRVDIEKQQRDYYLNQQLKTIQEELGQNPQQEEFLRLQERAKEKQWSKTAEAHFMKELQRLKRMNPQVAEYSIQLNYLDLFLDLPWASFTEDNFDLKKVKRVLDKDHFGLEKVKQRILEHLAVLKLKGDMKAPILCLVGPPGVGKTSLGRSIAEALNREFVLISLGVLHDESEIRGHRKTYIGAMPGRIIQSLKKTGSSNPVFILDEIDKVGSNFRGDPSSALLEVLDPEQNGSFYDNYLEVEYDLSKILFIATANSLSSIQPALLDRMEIIDISGYSMEEKVEIAKRHLIPRQLKEHGLKKDQIKLKPKVLRTVVQAYTRESGVRSLNREIGALMRYVAKQVAMEEAYNPEIAVEELTTILGPSRFSHDIYREKQAAGVAIGLAWTPVGGAILFVESSKHKGNGKVILTGNLGDVMKESASTALSFIKAHREILKIDQDQIEKTDLHIHIPEGAIPKDGPSAGITMLTALTSLFTGRRVKPYLAMTGEITLRGKVLPVGGIKEKILAAKRAGMKEIILCAENKKHVAEINPNYVKGLTFHYVKTMKEVIDLAIL
ncbi:MAG: endopeptidase La [Saprospiraceae bacterium]|nr:endopeptidase La [Saprospiraceae bacterium]